MFVTCVFLAFIVSAHDKQQSALNVLQESVQYVHQEMSSDESIKNVDKVEMLQDKFEALLQIMDAQVHRVRFFFFFLNPLFDSNFPVRSYLSDRFRLWDSSSN